MKFKLLIEVVTSTLSATPGRRIVQFPIDPCCPPSIYSRIRNVGTDPSMNPSRLSFLGKTDQFLFIDGNQAKIFHTDFSGIQPSLGSFSHIDEGNVAKGNHLGTNPVSLVDKVDTSALTGNLQSCCVHSIDGKTYAFICDSKSNIALTEGHFSTDDSVVQEGNKRKFQADYRGRLIFKKSSAIHAQSDSKSTTGWSGIGLTAHQKELQCANYLSRTLHWFDLTSHQVSRVVATPSNPTAICNRHHNGSLEFNYQVIAEGGLLSVWDQRQRELGGCAIRENISRLPLWSIITNGEHEILLAGSDRTVYIYDTRTWKAKLKWKSPCKYDIVKILPTSTKSPSASSEGAESASSYLMYVVGSDNEIMLCDMQSSSSYLPTTKGKEVDNFAINHANLPTSSKLRLSHHRGVRAESRWLGIDATSKDGNDILHGVCDVGKFYIVQDALNMYRAI